MRETQHLACIGDAVKGYAQLGEGREAHFMPFSGFVTDLRASDAAPSESYASVAVAGLSILLLCARENLVVVGRAAMLAPFTALGSPST